MSEIITMIGLGFDIVGVVLLFWHAPEKFSDPQWSTFFAVEGESKRHREEWLRLQPRRRKIARFAVSLIVLGFALQFLGEFLALRGA